MHGQSFGIEQADLGDTIAALEGLRDQGKIRCWGVSNFGLGNLRAIEANGNCATNQVAYSLLARAVEYEIAPHCVEAGIGILCYSPLAQGLLTGKFRHPDEVPEGRARTRHFSKKRSGVRHGEDGCEAETFAAIEQIRGIADGLGVCMDQLSLARLLHQPGVTSILAGARTAQQAQSNAAAVSVRITPETLAALNMATATVKEHLGRNPDLWSSKSRVL